MVRGLHFLLAASLCACAPGERKAAEPALEQQARPIILGRPGPNGAPEWRAVIVPGRLLLDSPTSAGWYAIALPPPRQEAAPRRLTYESGQFRLVAEIGTCAIPQYRDLLPNRVVLHWDSGRFEGCNGRGSLPDRIEGTIWELIRLGGEPAPRSRSPAATLVWGATGSLGGTLACNDGGIRSTWTANGGFAHGEGGFEQTAMGCNDPGAEAFGARFWAGLAKARSWRRSGDRLLIGFADGSESELRFLIQDQMSSVSRP